MVDQGVGGHQIGIALESDGELRSRVSQVKQCRAIVLISRRVAQLLGTRRKRRWADVLVLGASEEVDQCPEKTRRVAQWQVALQSELEDVLAQKHDQLGSR